MNAFFAWLSTPGPFEEILTVVILLILLGFVGFLIAKGSVDCDIKSLRIKSKSKDNKEKPNDKPVVQEEKPVIREETVETVKTEEKPTENKDSDVI